VSTILLLGACLCRVEASAPPRCTMTPRFETLRFPEKGFTWLEGEEFTGPCDEVEADRWIRRPIDDVDLMFLADGPNGSGLYWNVALGIAPRHAVHPDRGVCFVATTVGARTLGEMARRGLPFFKGPNPPIVTNLPWIDDLDADGRAEIILWDSFPIVADPAVYQFGLIAWVYHVQPAGTIAIDWALSRRVAREIAGAYRASLKVDPKLGGPLDRKLSSAAADALEAFAGRTCAPAAADVR
jgi:hypothetical protein